MNTKYEKPVVIQHEENNEQTVFAGGCGDFTSSCGAAVHRKGATGACGDYTSSCAAAVHRKSGNAACGDFTSSCGKKVHKR